LPLQESPVVSPLLSHELLVVSPLLLSQESSPLSLLLAHPSPLLSVLPLLAQPSAQALHTSTAVGPEGSEDCCGSAGSAVTPASAK
jgi:hypothetical protein